MKSRWVFRLYNLLVLLVLPFIFIGVLLRWRKRIARGMERWGERWGRLEASQVARFSEGSWWWVHAVSLGEVKAIEVFLRQIPERTGAKVLLSVVTPEAIAYAVDRRLAQEIIAAPVDLPWVVRRVFRAVKPRLFVSVESEFWPNLLREAKRAKARVALVNGRISAHSFSSYTHIRSIMAVLWDCFDVLLVRQSEDASRFIQLGVPESKVRVSGNLKYDMPLPDPKGTASSAPSGLTVVIGSSREGEEKLLLPVLESLRQRHSTLSVILAPRHMERVGEIETLMKSLNLGYRRKTMGGKESSPYLLWDSMGDLMEAYQQADVAIVGGSFVQKGGQNPLEPASLGVPVLFGPSMENFLGISEVLLQHKGARQVTVSELGAVLQALLENPAERQEMGKRARVAVESRQGATEKTLDRLKELVRA